MEHLHPVTDTDAHFVINTITRDISAVSGKTALIQGDHNSERFTFELSSRYVERHDMSLCNVVQVHYINGKSAGICELKPVVSEEDTDKVVMTWLISNNATKYSGALRFLIKFKCISDAGEVEYEWNTQIFDGVKISEGINNGEYIAEGYPDILEQWRNELLENGGVTDERIAQAVEDHLTDHPISGGSSATIGTVNLLADAWAGSGNLYSQVVTVEGVTKNSQVDLTPSVEQLVVFHEKDLTFVTEQENGVVTVYAIGQKPENDYTIQATITEVSA